MEVASLSKQFTTAAIMFLQQENKLVLQDKVQDYLGQRFLYPTITVLHLLTHTSGLPNYEPYFRKHWDTTRIANNKDILTYFQKEKATLKSIPREKYSYSNSGYIMLEEVVEAASGQPLDIFLKDRIFKPAGIHTSAFISGIPSGK